MFRPARKHRKTGKSVVVAGRCEFAVGVVAQRFLRERDFRSVFEYRPVQMHGRTSSGDKKYVYRMPSLRECERFDPSPARSVVSPRDTFVVYKNGTVAISRAIQLVGVFPGLRDKKIAGKM